MMVYPAVMKTTYRRLAQMWTASSSSLASRWETSFMVLLGTMIRMSFTALTGRSTMARR